MTQPMLPYPEPDGTTTAGHSGSDTSRERARREVADGTVSERHNRTLGIVTSMGFHGCTVADLRDITGWHHGQASAALSTLHQTGRLVRLTERRDRCLVYVTPEYVGTREQSPYRRNKQARDAEDLLRRVLLLRQFGEGLGETWRQVDSDIERFLRG